MRTRRSLVIVATCAALGVAALLTVGRSRGASSADTRAAVPDPAAVAVVTGPAMPPAAVGDCPVDRAVCRFAAALSGWLSSDETLDLFLAAWQTSAYLCPDPTTHHLDDPLPLCDGAKKDELRVGYPLGRWRSEGGVLTGDELRDMAKGDRTAAVPSESDRFGTGEFRLYTVGCPAGDAAACKRSFILVFSGIGHSAVDGSPMRWATAYIVRSDGPLTSARIVEVLSMGDLYRMAPIFLGGRLGPNSAIGDFRTFYQVGG